MLHPCFGFALWNSQIVYVYVTSLFWICTLKFSNCFCECYIIVFRWTLWSSQIFYCINVTSLFWICIVKFSNCLCKCYSVVLDLIRNFQIVYVNVTSLCCISDTKFSDCLCKCYIVVLYLIRSYQIVYVNVTSLFCIWYEVLRLFV
jgi:hypothetical protein